MNQLELFSQEEVSGEKVSVSIGAKKFLSLSVVNSCSINIHRRINIRHNNKKFMIGYPQIYTEVKIFSQGLLWESPKEVVDNLWYIKSLIKNAFMPHGFDFYGYQLGHYEHKFGRKRKPYEKIKVKP